MRPLVIVGGSGHARELLDIVSAINAVEPTYEVLGVIAARADEPLLESHGVVWLGDVDALADLDADYAVGVGLPWARRPLAERVAGHGRALVSLVDPSAAIGTGNQIGEGAVIAGGVRITTNVQLGRHVHLNVCAVVSHDCVIGDYVTVSPGALVNGSVEIGDDAFLGSGAIVNPGVRIGSGARIESGAVVVGDVPTGVTAFGVPARWEH